MFRKTTTAFVLGLCLLFAPVASTFAAPAQTLKTTQQEEIDYETVLLIAEALEDLDYCFAEDALQWYKEGTLTITKIESNYYEVVMPGGGGAIGILIDDAI